VKRIIPSSLAAISLAGCAGWQSALDPASGVASGLANLFWFFLAVCAVIWLLVLASVLYVAKKPPAAEMDNGSERRRTITVSLLVALTVVILCIFTFQSFYTTRGFAFTDKSLLTIKVTAKQWWWSVEYENPDAAKVFTTATEIHIPVGIPVRLQLEAADVIHSFWVPSLTGKQDLIPGRKNFLILQADKPGLYRGQCAEFCGLQHAHMALMVVAQSRDAFERWRAQQVQDAATPGAPERLKGMQIFLNRQCASCHTVSGTPAGATTGPNLTHFGSRILLTSSMHNTADNLEAWLRDPHDLKPGTNMPRVPLSPDERQALVAYLQGLK
jgi:cytochrome c oxidase subunit 2